VIDAAAPIDFRQRQGSNRIPQLTRALNQDVTTSVTITTAKINRHDQTDLVPVEDARRGVQRHDDTAGAHQAEDGGFADVGVPAQQAQRPEGR